MGPGEVKAVAWSKEVTRKAVIQRRWRVLGSGAVIYRQKENPSATWREEGTDFPLPTYLSVIEKVALPEGPSHAQQKKVLQGARSHLKIRGQKKRTRSGCFLKAVHGRVARPD